MLWYVWHGKKTVSRTWSRREVPQAGLWYPGAKDRCYFIESCYFNLLSHSLGWHCFPAEMRWHVEPVNFSLFKKASLTTGCLASLVPWCTNQCSQKHSPNTSNLLVGSWQHREGHEILFSWWQMAFFKKKYNAELISKLSTSHRKRINTVSRQLLAVHISVM